MSAGVMTLSYPQELEMPPSVRAPRTNFQAFLKKLVFGSPAPSSATTTTTVASGEEAKAFDREQESLGQLALTLSIQDSAQRIDRFFEALSDALELNATMADAEEGDPFDVQTWQYAVQSLEPLIASLELPIPLILPLQNGGISAEWHAAGMNVELRFRKPYDVYAVLEGRGDPTFHGRDPDLGRARDALRNLSRRCLE
jgi:hypothetical protein